MSCLASCALQELGTHVPMLTLINVVLEAGPFYKRQQNRILLFNFAIVPFLSVLEYNMQTHNTSHVQIHFGGV